MSVTSSMPSTPVSRRRHRGPNSRIVGPPRRSRGLGRRRAGCSSQRVVLAALAARIDAEPRERVEHLRRNGRPTSSRREIGARRHDHRVGAGGGPLFEERVRDNPNSGSTAVNPAPSHIRSAQRRCSSNMMSPKITWSHHRLSAPAAPRKGSLVGLPCAGVRSPDAGEPLGLRGEHLGRSPCERCAPPARRTSHHGDDVEAGLRAEERGAAVLAAAPRDGGPGVPAHVRTRLGIRRGQRARAAGSRRARNSPDWSGCRWTGCP